MKANKATPWVAGATIGMVLILVAGWFLAVSPTLTSAAESREATTAARDHNDLLRAQIEVLKEQSTHMEEYEGTLAALQTQIPQDADLSPLTTELHNLALSVGVTITTLSVTTPQAFVPVVTSAGSDTGAPAVATDGATSAGDATTTSEDATAGSAATDGTAAASPFPGVYALPLSLTVVGTYDATLAFLDALQVQSTRLYLVGTIAATSQGDAGAGGGRPATSVGDLETIITGFSYVLTDTAPVDPTAPIDPAAPAPALPVPSDQKNPFVPVS